MIFLRRAFALALVLALPSGAHASPQDLFGYGGRTTAMAMTGTAFVEGHEAVFANPAGLAPLRRRTLTVGLHGAGYRLSIDGVEDSLEPPRGLSIGFALPIPFGDVLQDRLVLGGAFYTPAAALLLGKVEFPEATQWPVLDRAQVIAIQLALGIDLHGLVDGLHLGIGATALADVVGTLQVELDETNAFSSVVEIQLLTAFAPNVGLRYVTPERLPGWTEPQWGVGLAYRHELAAHMALDIRTADLPIELPVLTVGGIVQYDPPTLIAEGFFRPLPDLMLVANLTTRFWEAYPGSQVATTATGRIAPPPRFKNWPSPRIAAEGTWHDHNFTLALRGGYAYEASPAPPARIATRRAPNGDLIPEDVVAFRVLDNDRHILTIGAGWTIHLGPRGERMVLDVYGQLHVLEPRTHLIGRTDTSPPMVTEGFILAGGWTFGVEF